MQCNQSEESIGEMCNQSEESKGEMSNQSVESKGGEVQCNQSEKSKGEKKPNCEHSTHQTTNVRTRLTKQENYERLTHQTNKPIVSTILTHPTTKQIEPNEIKSN